MRIGRRFTLVTFLLEERYRRSMHVSRFDTASAAARVRLSACGVKITNENSS